MRHHRRSILLAIGFAIAGCGGDSSIAGPGPGPTPPPPPPPEAGSAALTYEETDLTPRGDVAETSDGFTVEGSLDLDTGSGTVTFANADLVVRKDAAGRITSISGTAEIPSPHERITFDNPVEADVGLFGGRFLNENRDLGILLKEDTDYFVFRVRLAFGMNVATGETGEDATKPIRIEVPLGGEILYVVDYRDPMYYAYGAQDAIGAMGWGWSLNSRLPFRPRYPVEGLGEFDGSTIRTGDLTIYKVINASGQTVDNARLELHQTGADPLGSNLDAGYELGFNGAMSLGLSVSKKAGRSKTEVLGLSLSIPIGEGSLGYYAGGSLRNGVEGYAYLRGAWGADRSWWPAFLPVRPVNTGGIGGFVLSDGDFGIDLEGRYGIESAFGTAAMDGAFHVTPTDLVASGGVEIGAESARITGAFTNDSTTWSIEPPGGIVDAVADRVNADLGDVIADAQAAWEDVRQATEDYEFELSLRGLRASLPAIVSTAKSALANGIAAELSGHKGKVYYNSLSSHLASAAAPYYRELDRLAAESQRITDNAATRAAIESALRSVAARKIFTTTYTYKDPIFGIVLYSKNISRRVMSDGQAGQLTDAADLVPRIQATSDHKLRMEQIYAQVDDRAIFEKVKDEIQNGVIQIRSIGEFGYTLVHDSRAVRPFAVIGGRRRALRSVDVFDAGAIVTELARDMIVAMTS